jgi:hypothetical protein
MYVEIREGMKWNVAKFMILLVLWTDETRSGVGMEMEWETEYKDEERIRNKRQHQAGRAISPGGRRKQTPRRCWALRRTAVSQQTARDVRRLACRPQQQSWCSPFARLNNRTISANAEDRQQRNKVDPLNVPEWRNFYHTRSLNSLYCCEVSHVVT